MKQWDEERKQTLKAAAKAIVEGLQSEVFDVLAADVKSGKLDGTRLNPAFPIPRELRIAFLDKGFLVEYVGPGGSSDHIHVEITDAGTKSLLDFLGIDENVKMAPPMYYGIPSINTNFYLGDSIKRLSDVHFDWQSSNEISVIYGYDDIEQALEYSFWSNVTCFWTDSTDQLRVRRVDYLEFFPSPGERYNIPLDASRYEVLRHNVSVLPLPQFDSELHSELNQFIDLIHRDGVSESQITGFLQKCPEILEFAFGCKSVRPQVLLEWQYETDLPHLKPDFMIERMDGYFDIVEFKLPRLKSDPMVGIPQRRHPSFEIDTAIAQLDTYEKWTEQDLNRQWLEDTRGIRVMHPQRWLIIGTKQTFPDEDRQRLRRTRNTTVYTYDEFIGLVRHQLYRVR